MNEPDTSPSNTAHTRDTLLRIVDACAAHRYAHLQKNALEVGHIDGLRVVVFSARGLGFPQQLDQLKAAAAVRGGRIDAVVIDAGETDNIDYLREHGYKIVSVDDFFANPASYQGSLVVDRTCTWYPGVRYKVRLRQAGFAFLRVEQFLNAPGLEAAGGCYRQHSDLMLERFDEFLAVERCFKDALSLQTYYYALASFISMNHEYFAFHCGDYRQRYFAPGTGLHFDDDTVYADCGSHDGQEALIFAAMTNDRFKAVHAFEPDRSNFINLSDNVARYVASRGARPIYCHELGVYDRNAFLRADGFSAGVSIVADGSNSNSNDNSNETGASGGTGAGIHVCRLDDMLDELSHLRLEVEGAELEALKGAAGLIRRDRPSLTVSAYHKATDFLDLTRLIEETGNGYTMSLRHQSLEPGVLCLYAV